MNSKYKSVHLTEVLQFLEGKEENNKPFLFVNQSGNLETFFTYKGNMKDIYKMNLYCGILLELLFRYKMYQGLVDLS